MAMDGPEASITAWLGGLDAEMSFWRKCILPGGKNADHPHDVARRMERMEDFPYPDGWDGVETPRVLDVGAGPVSVLKDRLPDGKRIELHACDPLAPVYNRFLDLAGLTPHVRTRFALGERLREIYGRDAFDLVHMHNALDHSFDPLAVVKSMVEVCRTGGRVVLRHHENEAENEHYRGLHQWNVAMDDRKRFVLWNRRERMDVTGELASCARVEIRRAPAAAGAPPWILVSLWKRAPVEPYETPPSLRLYDEWVHQALYYGLAGPKNRPWLDGDDSRFAPIRAAYANNRMSWPKRIAARLGRHWRKYIHGRQGSASTGRRMSPP